MAQIKIDNIIYGSNNSADIIYKNTTVEEKLDTIPIFDINDNGNVIIESDVLTYGHIINTLDSDATDKVLSAKQGKILNEKFDNIDFSALENDINLLYEKINIVDEKTINNQTDIINLNDKIILNTNNIELLNSNILKEVNSIKLILSDLTKDNEKLMEKVFPSTVTKNVNYSAAYSSGSGYVTIATISLDDPRALVKYENYTVMIQHTGAAASSTVYYRVQGTHDGVNWTDTESKTGTRGVGGTLYLYNNATLSFSNKSSYIRYRIQVSTTDNQQVVKVQGNLVFG